MIDWINTRECPPIPYKDVLFVYVYHGCRFITIGHYATHLNAYVSASVMGEIEASTVTHWASIEMPVQTGV